MRFLCKPSHTNLFYFLLRHLEPQIRISKNAVEKSHQKNQQMGDQSRQTPPLNVQNDGGAQKIAENCGPILFLPSLLLVSTVVCHFDHR